MTYIRRPTVDWFGELIESHRTQRRLPDHTRYRDDPVAFIYEVLGVKELWWQQEVAAALVVREPRLVIRSGNDAGKDFLFAHVALWFVYARRGMVIVTSATMRQLRDIFMEELRRAWPDELPGDLLEDGLRVDRKRRVGVKVMTSKEASNLTGYHHENLLVLISEGQGVPVPTYRAMDANCRGAGNHIVAYGNPSQIGTEFHRLHGPASTWFPYKLDLLRHPNVLTGEEVIPGAISRDAIERVRREFGEGSAYYAWSILGEFPTVSGEERFDPVWLDAANERHRRLDLLMPSLREDLTIAADVARSGDGDKSSLCVRRGGHVLELTTRPGDGDLMKTARWVDQRYRHWMSELRGDELMGFWTRPAGYNVRVDVSGIGAGLYDKLKEMGHLVVEFMSQRKADDETDAARHLNARSAAYWRLRNLLRDGKLAVPIDPELREELLAHYFLEAKDGRMQLVDKDTVRLVIGRSPDKADALAMSVYQTEATFSYGGAMVDL